MPNVICLVGASSLEKTIIINKLIFEFFSRNIKLGLITRLSPELSQQKISLPPSVLHLPWPQDPSIPLVTLEELLVRYFYNVDLVISELKETNRFLVEVVDHGEKPAFLMDSNLKALICLQEQNKITKSTVPCFSINQIKLLAEYLIKSFFPTLLDLSSKPKHTLHILENGKRLPLNYFVEKIISNSIRAMVNTLKRNNNESSKKLEIHIY